MLEDNLKDVYVGVLGGGISNERDISLISAQNAINSLEKIGIKSIFIDIDDARKDRVKKKLSAYNIDLAFIAMHGEFGEDGKLQSILEEIKIPYTGSSPMASYLAMDKIAAKDIFLKNAITTPLFFIVKDIINIPLYIDYPVVVKPFYSGSSLGVSLVKNKDQFYPAIKEALSIQPQVLVEEYIEGRELTVGILGQEALSVVEIFPKDNFYNFNTKYSDGKAKFKAPADLDKAVYKKVQEVSLAAHKALGCRHFSRVDIRLDQNNREYVLEVNSIPGLTSHSLLPLSAQGAGINFDDLILRMLKLALYGKETAKKS